LAARPLGTEARFAFLFGAQFAGFGAMLPFLPAILAEGGLTPGQVGAVLALGSLTRLLAGPVAGRIADRAADARRVLAALCIAGAVSACGFGLAAGLAALLAVQLVHAASSAAVMPISDALAGRAVRAGGFDYAKTRAVGSITFIAGSVLAGQAAGLAGPQAAAWILAAGLAATAWAALLLPVGETPKDARQRSVWAPLREPGFPRVLAVAALVQGSHAAYYAFSTIHWQASGLSPGFVGLLWGLGVVAEVLLFLRGQSLADRLGVRGLALLAAGAGVLRWAATAVTAEPIPLLLINALQGVTFGAMHLAAMRSLFALPAGVAGRAQVLLSVSIGATTGVLMWASGPVFAALGGGVFWPMAALCGVAFMLALRFGR
jgi:PPP family 3-phenylpropionic acid transporter